MSSTSSSKDHYPITGIKTGFGRNGEVPMRHDIDEWFDSPNPVHIDQVSLFIAALKAFQAKPHSDKLSYFQVAGIHSEPLRTWDEGEPRDTKNEYCQHGTNLFPTWHRPYLLLFEQRLYEIMLSEIIPEFPKSQQTYLIHAAEQWRLPYWDWASKKPVYDSAPEIADYDVPRLIRLENVQIKKPGGPKWVKNPLYVFRMPDKAVMGDGGVHEVKTKDKNKILYFNKCKATSKYPPTNQVSGLISNTFIEGFQDNDSVMRNIRDFKLDSGNLTASTREAFYRVLTLSDYEDFSTTLRPGDQKPDPRWGSIETLHNSLHRWCGGGSFGEPAYGHMAIVAVAAFDPIFWLHHCNIDRLFALWQKLHPGKWFSDKNRAAEALKPFRKNEVGEYWTSNEIYETADLGYTYPILPKKSVIQNGQSIVVLDRTTEELNEEINGLYGSTRRAEQKAALTDERTETITVEDALRATEPVKVQAQIAEKFARLPDEPKVEDHLGVPDYVVALKYERFALNGMPFTINVLIGSPPTDQTPLDAVEYKSLIGQIFNFVAPLEMNDQGALSSSCANCEVQAEEKTESTGEVVLTNALITRYKQKLVHDNPEGANQVLLSMEPTDVINFLKSNLNWQINAMDGTIIPLEDVPSLKIAVTVGKADHYADPAKLSVYHDYKIMYDVTAGRIGGAETTDNLFAPGTEYEG